MYTLRVARTFFDNSSRTRMAQCVCSAHVISLHLTLSILMFHPPSLLFPHGHFETTFLSAQSLPDFTRSESAGQTHLRTSGGEFGYLADPTHSTKCQGQGPRLDKCCSLRISTQFERIPCQDQRKVYLSNSWLTVQGKPQDESVTEKHQPGEYE